MTDLRTEHLCVPLETAIENITAGDYPESAHLVVPYQGIVKALRTYEGLSLYKAVPQGFRDQVRTEYEARLGQVEEIIAYETDPVVRAEYADERVDLNHAIEVLGG